MAFYFFEKCPYFFFVRLGPFRSRKDPFGAEKGPVGGGKGPFGAEDDLF